MHPGMVVRRFMQIPDTGLLSVAIFLNCLKKETMISKVACISKHTVLIKFKT